MDGRIWASKGHTLTEAERLELGRLLLKAGYIVTMGREKQGSSYQHYIRFWRQVPFGYKEAAPGAGTSEDGKAQNNVNIPQEGAAVN